MAEHLKSIVIDDMPEILQVAEEVHASREPRVLRRGTEALAVVVPVTPAPGTGRRSRQKSEADHEAFRSAAGGWKDLIDAEAFIENIHESRRISPRPPVEL